MDELVPLTEHLKGLQGQRGSFLAGVLARGTMVWSRTLPYHPCLALFFWNSGLKVSRGGCTEL